MDNKNNRKLTEIALYILNSTGGVTLLYMHKIVYSAHRAMLSKYALPLTTDIFKAWDKGPVPQSLNGALYAITKGETPRLEGMDGAISYRTSGDMQGYFVADRGYDAKKLSLVERMELDEAIKQCLLLAPKDLIDTFHDSAWEKARGEDHRQSNTIEVADIITAGGVTDSNIIAMAEERVALSQILK